MTKLIGPRVNVRRTHYPPVATKLSVTGVHNIEANPIDDYWFLAALLANMKALAVFCNPSY